MDFITVDEAEKVIQKKCQHYGTEVVPFEEARGRVLTEDLQADRDLPPFDRATMDGIAIDYEAYNEGRRSFSVKATQAAGEAAIGIKKADECIEIMTGAAVDETLNTVVRYEDVDIEDGVATIQVDSVREKQSIHHRGRDRKRGDKVADAGMVVDSTLIGLATSIGKTEISVKKMPRVVVISTGDELVDVDQTPSPYQIRRSNTYTIQAVLQSYQLQADTLHLVDDYDSMKERLEQCLEAYDVIIMSGGVSKGKYDYVPDVLHDLQVEKLFHKIKQRPGKPFWFGKHENNTLFFAFPGNPVSGFMCLHRYFLPWLETSLGVENRHHDFAILNDNIHFPPSLQYFAQVKLSVNERGQYLADPLEGHGSGDFANLVYSDAFLELPFGQEEFKKGRVYKLWKYH